MTDLHAASNKMRYDLMHGGIADVLDLTNVLSDEQKDKARSVCFNNDNIYSIWLDWQRKTPQFIVVITKHYPTHPLKN